MFQSDLKFLYWNSHINAIQSQIYLDNSGRAAQRKVIQAHLQNADKSLRVDGSLRPNGGNLNSDAMKESPKNPGGTKINYVIICGCFLAGVSLFLFQNCAKTDSEPSTLASPASVPSNTGTIAELEPVLSYELKTTKNSGLDVGLRELLNLSDAPEISIIIAEAPKSGSITKVNNSYPRNDIYSYRPNPDFAGRDQFKVLVLGVPKLLGKMILVSIVVNASAELRFAHLTSGSPLTAGRCRQTSLERVGPLDFENTEITLTNLVLKNGSLDLQVYSDPDCSQPKNSLNFSRGITSVSLFIKPQKVSFISLDFKLNNISMSAPSDNGVQSGPLNVIKLNGPKQMTQGQCSGPYSIAGEDAYGNAFDFSSYYSDGVGILTEHFEVFNSSSCGTRVEPKTMTAASSSSIATRRNFWAVRNGFYLKTALHGHGLFVSGAIVAPNNNSTMSSDHLIFVTDAGLPLPTPKLQTYNNFLICDREGDPMGASYFGFDVLSFTTKVLMEISTSTFTLPACSASSKLFSIRSQYSGITRVLFDPATIIPRVKDRRETLYIRLCTSDSSKRVFGASQVIKLDYTPTETRVGPLQELVVGYSNRACSYQ